MAIAFDNCTTTSGTNSTATYSHTCTGSNLTLFVGVDIDSSRSISSITYNGVAMTLATSQTNAGTTFALYRLFGPSTGANNVVITFSGSGNYETCAASYTGTSQTALDGVHTTTATASTSVTETISTTADNCWHVMYVTNDTANISAGTGTTKRSSLTNFGFFDNNAAITPAGSNSIIATCGSSSKFWVEAAAIAPFTAATANGGLFEFM